MFRSEGVRAGTRRRPGQKCPEMEHAGAPGPGTGAGRVGEEGGAQPGSGLASVTAHVLVRLGHRSGAEFSHFLTPGNSADCETQAPAVFAGASARARIPGRKPQERPSALCPGQAWGSSHSEGLSLAPRAGPPARCWGTPWASCHAPVGRAWASLLGPPPLPSPTVVLAACLAAPAPPHADGEGNQLRAAPSSVGEALTCQGPPVWWRVRCVEGSTGTAPPCSAGRGHWPTSDLPSLPTASSRSLDPLGYTG